MAVFYNQATLSYRGGVLNSNRTTGELTEAATIAKTAVSGSYMPGDTVTYTLSIVNENAADLTATVSDDLGGYLYNGATVYPLAYTEGSLQCFVNGTLLDPASLTVTPGPPLSVEGLTVPAGGSAVLVYQATVTDYAPLGADASITNTATLTGTASPLTATAEIPMESGPALSLIKSMNPQTLASGEQVTYTFLLQNAGPAAADAAEAISVADTFDPLLADLTAALNGAALTANTDYTYNAVTGAFATTAGRITVPAATYAQDSTGAWSTVPGTATLTVTGTIVPATA